MSGIMLNVVGVTATSVPGAPTIGTATATGGTTATVAYTAPANNGGSVITSYTATSSPSGITGTLSQAGSGTITVTGLTANTAYTFTVTATNAVGTSAASAASNSITTLPAAYGAAFGGGFFAGQISTAGNGIADYNIVIGPVSSAQNGNKQFKTSNTGGDPTSEIDGPTNSSTMNSAVYPAAQFCEAVSAGGFTDWYMPAWYELEIHYYNLKPNTNPNSTSSGNPYSVPSRSGVSYTSGNPAQTSATAFRSGGGQQFESAGLYWASSQTGATAARYVEFFQGGQGGYTKTTSTYVRAIRRVAV
jgi:hypothetical protein